MTLPIINIVAGAHLPLIRKLRALLNAPSQAPFYAHEIPSNLLSNETELTTLMSRSAKHGVQYFYSIAPEFFNARRYIYNNGKLYLGVGKAGSRIAPTIANASLRLHFLIEPSASHLGRHYDNLTEPAKKQLTDGTGEPSPSWVPVLLSLYDSLPRAQVIAWDLTQITRWRELFLMLIVGDVVKTDVLDRLSLNMFSHSKFSYDSVRDLNRFEIDLDAIDSLRELRLGMAA